MRGHKKKTDTFAWARDAQEQIDMLLADHGRVFLSSKLSKTKLAWNHGALLLAQGHYVEVAEWAYRTLAKDKKKTDLIAVQLRACSDILKGEHAAAADRIARLKKRELTGSLVWLSCIARALDGDVEEALQAFVGLRESKKSEMNVLSFDHALGLCSELVLAVKNHAAAVLKARGDPQLTSLLFLAPGSSTYLELDVSSEGDFCIPVVADDDGGYVPAPPAQMPEREMSPEALGIDLDEYLFGRGLPERYVLYALRLQLAYHRKWRNAKAKKVLTAIIASREAMSK